MSLLTELENKRAPQSINISLLTELLFQRLISPAANAHHVEAFACEDNLFKGSIAVSDAVRACRNRIRPASVLGKGDPKSGQIAPALNHQLHLKSRHSRIYAIRRKWHAAWLFNFVIPAR
jgi:hypothetical protein